MTAGGETRVEIGALVGTGTLRAEVTPQYDFAGPVQVVGFPYHVVAELRQDGRGKYLELRFRIARDVPQGAP